MKYPDAKGILLVGHEATRTGAPIALLHILRWLKENSSYRYSTLLARGGDLEGEFQALARTFVMERSHFHPWALPSRILRNAGLAAVSRRAQAAEIKRFVADFRPSLVYVNSIASAPAVGLLSPGVPVVTHVHELEFSFQNGVRPGDWQPLLKMSRNVIACSKAVQENVIRQGVDAGRIETVYESIPIGSIQSKRNREDVLQELGLPSDAVLIVAGGSICWRKGTDLFVQVARAICLRNPKAPIFFAWAGGGEKLDTAEFEHDIRTGGLSERIRLLGSVSNPADYLDAAAVFVLPSREDPYPLICLEAAALGKPIVCFGGAGGMPEFVEEDCGFVVPYLDIAAFAERVQCLIDSPALRAKMGAAAREKVKRHDVSIAAPRILQIIERVIAEGN